MSWLTPFWYLGAFVLALGLLVVVHEWGHYAAARWCGVKVLRFSVGFGRPLIRRVHGQDGTEWVLSLFPLGGYVKMLDEREAPVAPTEMGRAFNRQPPWKRILIVAAGPVANLLLAIALYWLMFIQGVPEIRPVLAAPAAETVAGRAGVNAGEQVLKLDDRDVGTWTDFRLALMEVAMERRTVSMQTQGLGGEYHERTLDFSSVQSADLDEAIAEKLGFSLYRRRFAPVVGQVMSGSPAERAGIHSGDKVVSIAGHAIAYWDEVTAAIRANPGRSVSMAVQGATGERMLTLVPDAVDEQGKSIGRIGVAVQATKESGPSLLIEMRHPPVKALRHALRQTWDTAKLTLVMMGRMVTGEVSVRNLSGPVAIADYAGQSARMGLGPYLRFLALISISLGILNLLPVPVLDGGHLMYYLWEFMTGHSVSEAAQELGQRIGLGLLGLMMAIALYNDLNRLISS